MLQRLFERDEFGKSGAYRAARHLLAPAWLPIRARLRRHRHRAHAHPAAFDWDWSGVPYNRVALVNLLVGGGRERRYLEIGCNDDTLFASVPALHKVGVDPVRGGTLRMTSDAFFAGNDDKFDVIFIDGLHTYDQVRRDVINAMGALAPGGWIALHDMLPRDWVEQHVPRIADGPWTGDVWKVGFELAATEGVDFRILLIDQGVGVLRLTGPDPELADMRPALAEAGFGHLHDNVDALPLADWRDCQDWLRG